MKKNSKDIKNKYIQVFLGELTESDKQEIAFEQFIWHAFSYEKIPCLKGRDAIKEFKKLPKNEVYLFFQNNDDLIEMINLTYETLLDMIYSNEILSDCYVVDKNFKWTFVYTHETLDEASAEGKWYYIGPFFKSIDETYSKN